MSKIILSTILFLIGCTTQLSAQRLFRSQRPSYTLRQDAMSGVRSDSTRYMEFKKYYDIAGFDDLDGMRIDFELSSEWYEGVIMLHLDAVRAPYHLVVNGDRVAYNTDYLTPTDYQITQHLKAGKNSFDILFESNDKSQLSSGIKQRSKSSQAIMEGIYLYAEPRRRVYDYDVKIVRDSSHKYAHLEIAAIVENGYNYEEVISLGFDIYHPDGRLLDFSSRPVVVKGGSRDTVRFSTYIYNADSVRWSPNTPNLYSVTLLTRVGAVVESYTPIKVAYSELTMQDGVLYNFGERVEIKPFRFNAMATRKETEDELQRLKFAGYNTLCPDTPQPIWLYDMCDKLGFYIVEQTSINAPQHAENRAIGGSPSNDPALLSEYIYRMAGSYYRVRQHPSVVAFSLAGNSGNGYNMYKAYEWMKSVEKSRPIIYNGAQGEWNSDTWKIK